MRWIALITALALLGGCAASRQITLDCDPEEVSVATFNPDRSTPGFEHPKDALLILSWSRGTPIIDSSSESEVVFVYMEDRTRVGAVFVVPTSDGWVVDELWICPEL